MPTLQAMASVACVAMGPPVSMPRTVWVTSVNGSYSANWRNPTGRLTVQWLVLRRVAPYVGPWPVITLAGLVAGAAVCFAVVRLGLVEVIHWFTPEDFPAGRPLAIVGAITSVTYALITWPTLSRVLSAPADGAGHSGIDRSRRRASWAQERRSIGKGCRSH